MNRHKKVVRIALKTLNTGTRKVMGTRVPYAPRTAVSAIEKNTGTAISHKKRMHVSERGPKL